MFLFFVILLLVIELPKEPSGPSPCKEQSTSHRRNHRAWFQPTVLLFSATVILLDSGRRGLVVDHWLL